MVPFCGCSFLFIIRLLGEGLASVPRVELGQLFYNRKEHERKEIEVEDKDMQEMKRNCDGSGSNGDVKKERHIVTWSQQVPFLASLSALTHLASRNVIISLPFLEFFCWL